MPTPTQDGQISVNGLLLGAGTTYDVVAFNPYQRAVRHNQTDRAWTDGAWSGRELTAATAIPLRVHIVTDTTAAWVAAQQSLTAALRRTTSDVELRWRLGGTEYLMFVRPRLVEPDPSTSGYGHGPVTCALMALDPRIYSADQQQQQLGLPSAAGGATYPITYPLTIAATVTSGRAEITNTGTEDTPLLLRIDAFGASLTQPRVSLRSAGVVRVLRFDLTLTTGQWLDVDTSARTVYLNGTTSRRGNTSGDWPLLPAGTSELAFDAAAYTAAAQLTATWRHAW